MRILRILLAVSLIACGGGDTAPAIRVDGTWQLQSINGTLPFTQVQGSTTVTYTGSVLTIATNGTYNEVYSYRATTNGNTINGTVTELGTWTAVNGAVTFNDQTDAVTYQGSVSGNTLTEIVNNITQVYRRQ